MLLNTRVVRKHERLYFFKKREIKHALQDATDVPNEDEAMDAGSDAGKCNKSGSGGQPPKKARVAPGSQRS